MGVRVLNSFGLASCLTRQPSLLGRHHEVASKLRKNPNTVAKRNAAPAESEYLVEPSISTGKSLQMKSQHEQDGEAPDAVEFENARGRR
jgi:hypothetical protein